MTPDPLGFEDGLNLYAYVHNNPLIFIDPLGLSTNPLNYSMNRGKAFGKGAYNMFTDPIGTGYKNWARIGNMANTFYNKGFSGVYNDHMPKNFTEGADFFCDQGGQFIGGAALVASSVFAAAEVLPAAASAVLNTGRWIQRGVSLKNTWNRLSGSFNKIKPIDRIKGSGKNIKEVAEKKCRNFSRQPKSIQDQMTLKAAYRGQGEPIIRKLNDSRYQGMTKMRYRVKSVNGKDSVVHYVKDPKTGNLMDFKFKKHSFE